MKSLLFCNIIALNSLLVTATHVRRQDNGTSSAATSTVASASTVTAAASTVTATGTLFNFETVQLESSGLAHLNRSMQALFAFGDASAADASTLALSQSACKVFPGDAAWPADDVWDIFNDLLGGALIKTVPIASSCYNDWDYVRLPYLRFPNSPLPKGSLDALGAMLIISIECRHMCLCNRQLD